MSRTIKLGHSGAQIQLVFILFILHKITSSDALCPCTLNSDEEKDNKGEKTSLILTWGETEIESK